MAGNMVLQVVENLLGLLAASPKDTPMRHVTWVLDAVTNSFRGHCSRLLYAQRALLHALARG
eukprot:2636792-Rhodomonas_salina.1